MRPFTATTRSAIRPTASTAACGGVMMALKASTPNIPRLLMVNVPPVTSGGCRRPARARSAKSCRLRADVGEPGRIGVRNHGAHHSVLHRDGDADVHVRI